MILREPDFHAIIEHCEREYPNEACGILAGRGGRVENVYPMTNAEPSPTFYLMDSREQFRVMKDMHRAETELVGIYHSHTAAPAFPSGTDVSLAYYPEAVYVIVSLMDRKKPVIKGFTIVEGKISEVPVHVRSGEACR